MTIFEDDAINDDFEVEITDLEPENETDRISSAIVALCSRISFKARANDTEDASPDDFELEITDLPAGDEESGLPAAIAALHSRLPRKTRLLRQVIMGIALLLVLGVVLETVPSSREALLGLFSRTTPTTAPTTASREFGRFRSFSSGVIVMGADISISLTPISGVPVASWNPNTPVANVLNPPPETCPSTSLSQNLNSIDYPYDNPIGSPPLWVMGFHGYPTNLTGFIRATPPQYGWVRQVTVMLAGTAVEPVMLSGARLQDGTPLLFRDPHSGQNPTTFLTLNPGISTVSDSDGDMIGGIAPISLYIPSADCYYLKASWVGGSWEAIFGAGA